MHELDRLILQLRFDEAASVIEADADRARLGRLALTFGRYRTALTLGLSRSDEFLRRRALPMVPIRRSERGFSVDEEMLRQIAAELKEPLPPLLGEAVRWMLARGSRHAAKLFVLAQLSGERALIDRVAPEFHRRALEPRRALPAQVAQRFSVEPIQAGDDDDYNPKSAHLFAGRDLIVKEHLRLHVDPSDSGGYSDERALQEAVDHPCAARLVDVAQLGRHELLLLARAPGRTLDGSQIPDARRCCAQLAEFLAHLHAREILYLDVKPRNLIWDGRALTVCDFGMARRGRSVTSLLSTLEYVPPEMAREFTATAAADVFQLGIVLHQLLTGRHPFSDGEGIDVALANLWDEPRLQAEPDLIGAMLAKRPEDRPSAKEVAERLS